MKIIQTRTGFIIEAFNGPTEAITPDLLEAIMKPVRENKLRVLQTAFNIEDLFKGLIADYFFGRAARSGQACVSFESLILDSDWCSYSAKRKLVLHIVNECNLLEGDEKSRFDQLSRKVIGLRNAFAHGAFSTDGRQVKLKYFEGIPRVQILSDEYLTGVEAELNECFDLALRLSDATLQMKTK